MTATYKRAIQWLASNDDNEWLRDDVPVLLSVTASLVQDLYGKTAEQVRADLVKELRHIHPNSWFGALPWETDK
jgi:hypothetical protein